jgi:hypothetical protein
MSIPIHGMCEQMGGNVLISGDMSDMDLNVPFITTVTIGRVRAKGEVCVGLTLMVDMHDMSVSLDAIDASVIGATSAERATLPTRFRIGHRLIECALPNANGSDKGCCCAHGYTLSLWSDI